MADNSNNSGWALRGHQDYISPPRDGTVSPKPQTPKPDPEPKPKPEWPPEDGGTSATAKNYGWHTNHTSPRSNASAYNHFAVPGSNRHNTTLGHSSPHLQNNSAIPRSQAQTATAVTPSIYSDGTTANNGGVQAAQYQTPQTPQTSFQGVDAGGNRYTATWDYQASRWSYEYD